MLFLNLKSCESDMYYFNGGICGDVVDIRGRRGVKSHLIEMHPEWTGAYITGELFCSPNLKNIINKEPLQGDECRDYKIP